MKRFCLIFFIGYCLAPYSMADETKMKDWGEHKVKDYDWEEFNQLRQERDEYEKQQKMLKNSRKTVTNNQSVSPEVRDGLRLERNNAPAEKKSDRLWDVDSDKRIYQMKK